MWWARPRGIDRDFVRFSTTSEVPYAQVLLYTRVSNTLIVYEVPVCLWGCLYLILKPWHTLTDFIFGEVAEQTYYVLHIVPKLRNSTAVFRPRLGFSIRSSKCVSAPIGNWRGDFHMTRHRDIDEGSEEGSCRYSCASFFVWRMWSSPRLSVKGHRCPLSATHLL